MKTRGEEMLALRKARIAAAPPILRGGFRPFFFLGSVWAALALVLWIFAYLGALTLPAAFDALAWHRHEMLFGFIGAIVAGFLLTAIPNWTGRLPIAGGPLAALAGLWLAARIAVFWSDMSGLALAAALDVGFYFVFALVAGREVVAARNRNLPVVVLVLLLGLANAADYAGAAGLMGDTEAGYRAGIALVVMMITLIGGRIIPSFTRNWMVKAGISQGLPGQPDRFDRFAIAVTAAAMLAWVLSPRAYPVGFGLALAALVLLARLLRWGGWKTVREPIVAVLHVGYLWIPAGLLLLGWSIIDPAIPRTAAIHALTAGAMATMILAVMTRATLGHTGREIKAGGATAAIYLLVTLGALLRLAAPMGWLDYRVGIEAAGTAWAGAMLLFAIIYGPILFRSRPGE